MTQPLNIEMVARLNSAGVKSGAKDARQEISRIGDAARDTARDIDAVTLASNDAARAQANAARAGNQAAQFTEQYGLRAANANRLAAHEATNLSFQMQDIAVSLASGQSPFIVMAQQGSQVSQIMGSRGLGQILPAIAGAIGSMINPTTILFAGLAAGAYAAQAAFRAMRGEVDSLADILDDHTDLIRQIKDAYAEAEDGARSYAAASSAALELDRVNQERRERDALRREYNDFLDALGPGQVQLQALGTATEPFKQAEAAIKDLIRSAEEGDAEFSILRERLAEIALSPDLSNQQRSSLSFVTELTKAGESAEIALKETASGLDAIGKSFDDVIQKTKEYQRALEKLQTGDRTRGRRDLARDDYLDAIGAAQDTRERILVERAFRERLNRITDQENASRIPVPRARPVDIDRGSEARELLRTQEEQIAKLRLEASLIGQSDAVRRRALATLEAEVEIRNAGIDAQSREADRIRENAAAIADMNTELEASQEAWESVKATGERSIDTLVDKLSSGDFEGALKSIASDITKQLLTLGAANPLKNALYGSGLPTISDVGGIGGFFQSLLGGGPVATASMQVQAATVLVNGGLSTATAFNNIPGTGGSALGLAAGNDNAVSALANQATSRLTGTAPTGSVAGQIWNYFIGKGLQPHQVAGIMGNVSAESAFNPFAIGDGGNAFGLFQHNDRRFNLFDFIGGRKNLGNVQGQLDFAWHELMTSENRSYQNLLRSSNVREATAAFGGFERPRGFSWGNPEAMHNWTGRLQAAEEALGTFGNNVTSATSGLTQFDSGIGKAASALVNGSGSLADTATAFVGETQNLAGSFTSGLQNVVSGIGEGVAGVGGGGGGGGFGGFFSAILGGIGSIFGFQRGGATGNGSDTDVKGLVHANEYVFSAPATRRIGVRALDALHKGTLQGYQDGGFVTSYASPVSMPAANGNAMSAAPVEVSVHNYSNATVETREERDERGGRKIRFVMSETVSDAINTPGGATQRTLRENYNLRKQRVRR